MLRIVRHILWILALSLCLVSCGGGGGGNPASQTLAWDQGNWDGANWQ